MLRLWPRLAAVALAGALFLPALPAQAAPSDELAQKREQAEELQRQIAQNGTRISVLDEDYNEARIAVEQAAEAIAHAEVGLADAEARAAELRSKLAARAARIYVDAGSAPLAALEVDEVTEIQARNAYMAAAAEADQALIGELGAAHEDLGILQERLESDRADAQAQQDALGAQREELEQAQRDQQALLDSVEGDIVDLVAEIEAQRQREEEERARKEIERRRQAEEAERAARAARTTTTTARTPASGGPPAPGGGSGRSVAPNVPAPNANAQIAVDTALAQLGKPYRYAGKGPDVFDCSGLTQFAWAAAGLSIPHSSRAQYAGLAHVSMEELAPGDLVFYGNPIHHVGIYVGDGQYVHAPQTGDVVKISSIYRRDYTGSARPG